MPTMLAELHIQMSAPSHPNHEVELSLACRYSIDGHNLLHLVQSQLCRNGRTWSESLQAGLEMFAALEFRPHV